jgi:AraC-like DNA-binding protein
MRQRTEAPTVLRSTASTTDFDEWRSLIDSTFLPMASELTWEGSFSGAIAAVQVGDIAVMRVDSVPQIVGRSARVCRHNPGGMVKVLLQRDGDLAVEQDDRRALAAAQSMTVYDVDTPYTVIEAERFVADVLLVPLDHLDIAPRSLSYAQARPIALDRGPAAIFAAHVDQLLTRLDECGTDAALRLADIAVDMLGIVLGEVAAPDPPAEAMRKAALKWIRAHLGDDDLDPGTVAAATGISLRHLHRVFGLAGLTVSTVIRQERLRRVGADLRDPLRRNQTIAAIGSRWGFTDQARLSRLFRQEYGVSPRDFRGEH